MKLVALALRNYRQFLQPDPILFGPGVIGISGPNGAGKSKIIEAIGYALFGPHKHILPDHDRAADLLSSAAPPKSQLAVELVFEVAGTEYTLRRRPGEASLSVGNQLQAETPTGVAAEIQKILRLSVGTYLGSFVAQQREVANLQEMKSGERQQLINRLIGVAQLEGAVGLASQVVTDRNTVFSLARGAVVVSEDDAQALVKLRVS